MARPISHRWETISTWGNQQRESWTIHTASAICWYSSLLCHVLSGKGATLLRPERHFSFFLSQLPMGMTVLGALGDLDICWI